MIVLDDFIDILVDLGCNLLEKWLDYREEYKKTDEYAEEQRNKKDKKIKDKSYKEIRKERRTKRREQRKQEKLAKKNGHTGKDIKDGFR